jgi:hypothetical protein
MTDEVVRLTFTGEEHRSHRITGLPGGIFLPVEDEEARELKDGMPIVVTVNGLEHFGVIWSVGHVPTRVSSDGKLMRIVQVRFGRDLYDHARKLAKEQR